MGSAAKQGHGQDRNETQGPLISAIGDTRLRHVGSIGNAVGDKGWVATLVCSEQVLPSQLGAVDTMYCKN